MADKNSLLIFSIGSKDKPIQLEIDEQVILRYRASLNQCSDYVRDMNTLSCRVGEANSKFTTRF